MDDRLASLLRFALVPVDDLRVHEQFRPALLQECIDVIARDGQLDIPILVESAHHVILDGHHRYLALKQLGCRRVPCYLVDYDDPAVELETWPEAATKHVTKAEVLERARGGRPFSPKTTRHWIRLGGRRLSPSTELPRHPVKLADLH